MADVSLQIAASCLKGDLVNVFDWIRYKAIPWYTSLGLTRRTVTLEVVGRKTGRPIRVSLSRTEFGGRSYFVSLGGESSWVRSVRSAGGMATIVSGKRVPVLLAETRGTDKPLILHAYVQERAFTHSGAQSARHFFGLGPNPTVRDMEAIADRYVVFEITPRPASFHAAA